MKRKVPKRKPHVDKIFLDDSNDWKIFTTIIMLPIIIFIILVLLK